MKTKTEIAQELWKNGSSIQAIAKLMNATTKQVHHLLRHAPAMRANQHRRKSQALPELSGHIGHLHNPYSTWESKHKPPLGSCVAWVVEDGKARQCGKPAKRQLCGGCAHKTRTLEAPLSKGVLA